VYNKQNHTYRYKNSQISNFIKNNLKILSSKFYSLIKTIKEHPDELVFIYDEYIASGGGVINLALVLEQHGFIWAKSVSDIKHKSSQKRFCAMTSYEGTLNSPKQIQLFINSFNQDDNKYGERCQIIIGSRKIAEGITIKNVRQGHIIIGHWNIPSIDQALGRIFRVGSHDSFSKKEEKYIRIYKHVSVRKGDIENEFTEPFSNEKTLDLTIYGIAEEKEYCNTQIYRILKEVAWDCPLVYGRNVLEGDEDYTRNSDYDTKNYKCYDYPKKYIDKQGDVWKYNVPEKKIIRDTYDLFYNNSEVTKLIEKIKKIFEKNSSYHLSQFYQLLDLEKKDEFLLLKTVDYLIMSKTKIKNRYGFLLTLNEYKNIYYLDDTIGIMPEYSSLVYKETPMISEITSLKELSNINQYTSDAENIKNFCKNPSIENIKKMNYRTLILLLETAYKLKSTKLSMSREEAAAIENVMKVLGSNLFYLDDGQKVIHVMYNTEYMGLGYNVVLQEINPNGNMRLFENGKWSYVKNIEDEERYIKQFKTSKKVNTEEWDDFVQGIYGFTDKDGKFKIKVKPLPGQRMTKGSVCEEASWSIPKLYDVINKLNALPSPNEKFDKLSKEELIERIQAQPQLSIFLNKDRSAKELKQIITLNTMDRKKICAFLQNWFRENKMYKENVV
jgi:hypothetical protein